MTSPKPGAYDPLAKVVGRLALGIALIVALVLPLGYILIGYGNLAANLVLMANVKADAITNGLITSNPELWPYQVYRLEELLSAEPAVAEDEAVIALDAKDSVLARAGSTPRSPVMRRSHALHDSGRIVGRVDVEYSLHGLLYGTGIAVVLGLILGSAVFIVLRVLPLRALRRITGALEEEVRQHQLAAAQREAAEAASRASDERFRQLAEHIPQVFWMTDTDRASIAYTSPAFETLTGVPATQGARWFDSVHEGDRERVGQEWSRLVRDGVYDTEFRLVHVSGAERWVRARAFPVHNEHGGIDRHAGITEDITESKRAQERLVQLAHYDHLTGLPNRVLFYDRLKQALAQARRNGWHSAVLVIDLDRFKTVNDTFGHAHGDELLQKISERLTQCVRSSDTVGRLGGDEFAVILNELAASEGAGLVAQGIIAALAAPFDIKGNELHTTASVGIAVYPSDSDNVDTLVSDADAAMYHAKTAGRGVYRFYTAEMNQQALDKVKLEAKLRRAVEHEEFLLYFQPKVDIATGAIAGCEALLRWASPEDGLVSPDRFIPMLEETGLIIPVGEWVLRAACRQVVAWKAARVTPVPIAVNLSARQFQQPDLGAVVTQALSEHGVAARYLEIEITESVAMKNAEASIETLRELKALGVRLAIDDFGTGYSSLSYLKRLPVDTVKIDRSFVTDLATNPDDATIAQAIISMAHNLGLKVVAEGVETASQLSFLRAHDCDQMQGYYFAKGLPEPEMTAMLAERRRLQRPSGDTHDGERTLLLLDDDPVVLAALERLLRHDDYRIFTANGSKAGFEILASHKVGVIISDQYMPEVTGIEFLRRVKQLYPASVRMVLSGDTELETVTEAIHQGAIYRYLTKPWNADLLRAHIADAFRHYARLQSAERIQDAASARLAELTEANRRLEKTLAEIGHGTHIPASEAFTQEA